MVSREIICQECQPFYDHDTSTLQTDRRTDRQLALAIPRYAVLRAVKLKQTQVYIRSTVTQFKIA